MPKKQYFLIIFILFIGGYLIKDEHFVFSIKSNYFSTSYGVIVYPLVIGYSIYYYFNKRKSK